MPIHFPISMYHVYVSMFSLPIYMFECLLILLADGAPTVGGGRLFDRSAGFFFTETAVTPERKVEKSFPRWEINRHAKD